MFDIPEDEGKQAKSLKPKQKSDIVGGSQPSVACRENLEFNKYDQNTVMHDILKDSSIQNSPITHKKDIGAHKKQHMSNLHKNETIMSDWLVPWNKVEVGFLIRTDRFGGTYAGKWHGHRTISIIKNEDVEEEELADFRSKVQMLRKTRHDNLLLFICASIGPSILAIVSEKITGQSLLHRISDDPFISEASIVSIIIQILNGLGYLHSRKIIHMNLNIRNIYYSFGIVKLCDFGIVSVFNQRKFIQLTDIPYPGFVIPKDWLNYQAPEILKFLSPSKHGLEVRRYNFQTDIFAFGIVYFELLMGHAPWHDYSCEGFLYKVCTKTPFIINGSYLTAKYIIQKCLEEKEQRFQNISEIEDIVYKMPRKARITRTPSQPQLYRDTEN
ncbi:hypothetical protein MXB_2284 [Myxobolus squamalis]|nr:hypothetical protein MXB_2284 [Myxobolus squamalis]